MPWGLDLTLVGGNCQPTTSQEFSPVRRRGGQDQTRGAGADKGM